MKTWIAFALVLLFSTSNQAWSDGGGPAFSKSLKDHYVSALLAATEQLESGSSSLTKKAKALCPALRVLLKNSTNSIRDLVPIEADLCKEAIESQGLECTGGGLTGVGAARALLRAELNRVCKLGKAGPQ